MQAYGAYGYNMMSKTKEDSLVGVPLHHKAMLLHVARTYSDHLLVHLKVPLLQTVLSGVHAVCLRCGGVSKYMM